ncbi:Esterase/lipase/thioesterase [Psilocybe cubensis]|uniref:Esterase/lipase/thioesterase n=2 Tax=Psilocybe cubensis TaxID=181762 RepID=A0ACB8GPQ5_PSICU|nr:Esterase/lipase/thioesterase [Psilocybe cubensis]KAH9477564.1 Esterase/lipase/thioesterase [Psilocybe cubensis]
MFGLVSLAIALAAQRVAAHGGVLSYSWSGQWYNGWQPYNSPTGQTTIQRPWSTYNPIQDATDSQLACNDDGTSGALQLTATVAAGTKITAYWNQVWPHPYGPMLTYLAQCPGSTCTGVNAAGLKWARSFFKIDEAGLISGTVYSGTWGAGQMINQNSSWTTTIPSSVPSGNYLIRFETIALHSLPAQLYPECAQITITGGGSLAPTSSELVTFPGGYSNSDPGLTVDIYSNAAQTMTSYPIPGPPLYAGATPRAGTSPVSSSSTKPASTSTRPASSSSSASSTPVPSSGTVPQYGQCGGQGWTGGTVCISPYKCTVSNPYYSQCL